MNEYSETITCADCGAEFDWSTPEKPESPLYRFTRPTTCQSCAERLEAREECARLARREAEHRAAADQAVSKLDADILDATPVLFQRTDIAHPRFNRRAWERLRDWQAMPERPWLGLVGATGACKSRIAYMLAGELLRRELTERIDLAAVQDLMVRPPSFAFVSFYSITEAALTVFSNDKATAAAARTYLQKLRACHILLIDDIGKGRLTPAPAAEVFALVDHRYQHQAVTIWTANTAPEVIAAGLPEDMGAPFAGRLNDSSTIFTFK